MNSFKDKLKVLISDKRDSMSLAEQYCLQGKKEREEEDKRFESERIRRGESIAETYAKYKRKTEEDIER